jgi:hypothetical protein
LKIYNVEITPLRNKEAQKLLEKDSHKPEAFIFNSSTHWFAIRKIDDIWFNLNSTNSLPGPEIISDFYLSAFIQGTEDIGYTNFLVKNLPPLMDVSNYYNLQPYQRLVPIDDVLKVREAKMAKNTDEKEKEEDKNKFKAFTGKGYSMDEGIDKTQNNFESDPDLKKAFEESMSVFLDSIAIPPEPKDGEEAYNVVLKYNDVTLNRKFGPENTISVRMLF